MSDHPWADQDCWDCEDEPLRPDYECANCQDRGVDPDSGEACLYCEAGEYVRAGYRHE